MWNFCDDAGNIPYHPKQIKMQVFPGDNFGGDYIEELLNELIKAKLLICYQSGTEQYLHVTGWHHQKIEKKSTKYPGYSENSTTIRRPFDDHSTTAHPRKGKEGKGDYSKEQERDQDSSLVIQRTHTHVREFPPPPTETPVPTLNDKSLVFFQKDKDKLSEQLRLGPESWHLAVTRVSNGKITSIPQLLRLIPDFINHIEAQDDWGKPLAEYRRRFSNWVAWLSRNKKEETTETGAPKIVRIR